MNDPTRITGYTGITLGNGKPSLTDTFGPRRQTRGGLCLEEARYDVAHINAHAMRRRAVLLTRARLDLTSFFEPNAVVATGGRAQPSAADLVT